MGRRKKGLKVDGWVCLDKAYDLTSTDAVARVRRAFGAQKAGHAGTLDPLATGVLPIALGEATKTVPFLMDADKEYRFTLAWGVTTASFDREGDVVATSDVRPPLGAAADALAAFVGETLQVPPDFSAVKVDGARAYDLAREGVAMALQARPAVIHDAEVADQPDADHLTLRIVCGKGVYVRALVRDLAERLGACAHVSALRRTRVGRFAEVGAITLENLAEMGQGEGGPKVLLPVATALDDIPAVAVTAEDAFRLAQGRSVVLLPRQAEDLRARLAAGRQAVGEAPRTVSAMAGERLAALCEMRAGRLNPVRVFNLDVGD